MESIIPNQVNPPPPSPNFQRSKSPNQWNNPNQGYPQPGNRNQSVCLGLKLLSVTGTNDQISTTAAASNVITVLGTNGEIAIGLHVKMFPLGLGLGKHHKTSRAFSWHPLPAKEVDRRAKQIDIRFERPTQKLQKEKE
ncbi:hypothetical protein EV2_014551 [Malus domestica]